MQMMTQGVTKLLSMCVGGTRFCMVVSQAKKDIIHNYNALLKANAPHRDRTTMALITFFFPPTPAQSKNTDDKSGIGIWAHGFSLCQFHFFFVVARCQDKSY